MKKMLRWCLAQMGVSKDMSLYAHKGRTAVFWAAMLLLAGLPSTSLAAGTTFYIDGATGDDTGKGTDASTPWKTLAKVNGMELRPGDRILLKRGQVFAGPLLLNGSGVAGNPIVLGAYGTGNRPLVTAGISRENEAAVLARNAQYVEISEIETRGGHWAGILVDCTLADTTLNHIRITNCYAHDVGDDTAYAWNTDAETKGGGIIVTGYKGSGNILNDVVIDGCTVRYIRNRFGGIGIFSSYNAAKKGTGCAIRHSAVEYTSGDGFRAYGCDGAVMEYCTVYKTGTWPNPGDCSNMMGLGFWFWSCDNCTIQYCEAGYCDASKNDGGAFEIDYWQTNSTIQYCYGHDCHSYGLAVFGGEKSRPTVNSTLRYNILANNNQHKDVQKAGAIWYCTWSGGSLDGVKCYNNTIIHNPYGDVPAFSDGTVQYSGKNANIFMNNLIYSTHGYLMDGSSHTSCDFNLYWYVGAKKPYWWYGGSYYTGFAAYQAGSGQDAHGIYADPLLNDPLYHGDARPGMEFRPRRGSPAIGAGADLGETGGMDFLGGTIPAGGAYDIGACEYSY